MKACVAVMNFSQRKLPIEAASTLRRCPIHLVEPFVPMLAPVYVFLKRNQKFVSLKAPLDFFTPEELDRFKTYEALFFPEFVERTRPFREAARRVRSLLLWEPPAEAGALPPTPYEISDACLRLTGPLWGAEAVIELFFVTVFVSELCEQLPSELLCAARDQDFEKYECAIFRSSWAVFMGLHLGQTDLGHLNRLRKRVFAESMGLPQELEPGFHPEIDELTGLVGALIIDSRISAFRADDLQDRGERVAHKLLSRLTRVKSEMIDANTPAASIYGPGGFADA